MRPQYIVRQRAYARLRLLREANRLGNVTRACRRHGFPLYLDYYNTCRPHGSLNWRTPTQHLQAWHLSQSVNHA